MTLPAVRQPPERTDAHHDHPSKAPQPVEASSLGLRPESGCTTVGLSPAEPWCLPLADRYWGGHAVHWIIAGEQHFPTDHPVEPPVGKSSGNALDPGADRAGDVSTMGDDAGLVTCVTALMIPPIRSVNRAQTVNPFKQVRYSSLWVNMPATFRSQVERPEPEAR
ncbi:hypothetical protein ACFXGA_10140 [Actinosynnema sp. NPDC059335]|uniref:hypothetical protein n=1 Tax=Actinosynnema sp. NPDC059335 TaxID=3346804 RepID=UPI0036705B84